MEIVFVVVILIMSVVIHEVAHGYAAYVQGDPTAALQGRLTLNPIKHLDLLGSIIVPGFLMLLQTPFLFGWAKPVPYNPYNLSDQRWGELKVALAGPLSNVLLAVIFAFGIRFMPGLPEPALTLAGYVVLINLVLAIFNLIPVPPLDGSKVLAGLFPIQMARFYKAIEGYGLIVGLVAIFLFLEIFPYIMFGVFHVLVGPKTPYVLNLIGSLF